MAKRAKKPILDLLNISPETELEVRTDGQSLILSPAGAKGRSAKIRAALEDTMKRYPKTLKRLAQ